MHDDRTHTDGYADTLAGLDDGPTMRHLIGTCDDQYLGRSVLDLRRDTRLEDDRDNRKAEVTFAETVTKRRGVVETRREVTIRLSQDRITDVLDEFRFES